MVIFPCFQIFFDDSTRNIAGGKAAGLHTVIVSQVHKQSAFVLLQICVRSLSS